MVSSWLSFLNFWFLFTRNTLIYLKNHKLRNNFSFSFLTPTTSGWLLMIRFFLSYLLRSRLNQWPSKKIFIMGLVIGFKRLIRMMRFSIVINKLRKFKKNRNNDRLSRKSHPPKIRSHKKGGKRRLRSRLESNWQKIRRSPRPQENLRCLSTLHRCTKNLPRNRLPPRTQPPQHHQALQRDQGR